jgi:chromosome segregation ATPase
LSEYNIEYTYHGKYYLRHPSFKYRRTYEPWYDENRDYNTNAKSYYDYLARFNAYLREMTETINYLLDKIEELENRIEALENKIIELENRIETLENKVIELENRIVELEKLKGAVQKIVNNLFESGAITNNNIDDFEFKNGRDIATGNINLFGGTPDGNSFIKTSDNQTQNDITAGI